MKGYSELMKKNDIKIILAVLIIAGIFYIFNQIRINNMSRDQLYVEINVDGELYQRIKLSEEKEIRIDGTNGYNIIKIHDDGVEIVESDCPDKICVKTGFITQVGKTIVCLPHKIYIEIVGREDELDAISQ
ncbi:lipoprotein [Vallitalea longa]|uniref:Lipoprotein n=1 Tax=Vallitalea longa TaxID=2936439 RepID=A0A9W5Y995_9FIRM|nr:NusG domain II-containing protein [Vallitalea longa]GKX28133.1 lipoprotein [Vallitalea longa]